MDDSINSFESLDHKIPVAYVSPAVLGASVTIGRPILKLSMDLGFKVVNNSNLVPFLQEEINHMRADKTGSTSDEDILKHR
jgi:hypothetical protein